MIDYITGATGFIGKKLLNRLDGDTCAICIPHQDIATYKLQDFSKFFFLSTYGNMADQQDFVKIFKANVTDVLKTVRQISEMKFEPELFLYVSSSSVNLPVQTSYSRTKLAAEHIIALTGVPACIVRPYSITGISEQENHLIPTLIRSCLEQEPMSFIGNPVHDYVDIEDFVDGLVYLADTNAKGIFEIGSGRQVTNSEVRAIVENECGAKANVVETKWFRSFDTDTWFCKETAWMPKKSLETSIHEMVEDYKTRKGVESRLSQALVDTR